MYFYLLGFVGTERNSFCELFIDVLFYTPFYQLKTTCTVCLLVLAYEVTCTSRSALLLKTADRQEL